MRILSPISKVDEVEKVIKVGADEIYCSVLSKKWLKTYPCADNFNSSSSRFSNLRDYNELKKVVDIAHSHDVPVFFTLNSFYYSKHQYPLLIDEINNATKCNIDAFIIADLGMLHTLNRTSNGIETHISVVGGAFNSKIIKFYQKMGISRVVLPKQLTIEEMKNISKKIKKIKLEWFILTNGCPNAEAYCRFQHGIIETKYPLLSKIIINTSLQGTLRSSLSKTRFEVFKNIIKDYTPFAHRSACSLRYNFSSILSKKCRDGDRFNENIANNLYYYYKRGLRMHCGVCALMELKKRGIHSIKTEDGSYPLNSRLNNITFLRNVVSYIKKNKNKEAIRSYAKEQYSNMFKVKCNKHSCNYPFN